MNRALALACMATLATSANSANAVSNEFDCLIEPSQVIDVRSPVSGLIDRVYVERGGVVKKGMVVFTLESSVEKAAANLARFRAVMEGAGKSADSRLNLANKRLKRKSDLADKNYTSVQDRDDAEAEQRIAEAEALTARENKQLAQLEHVYASTQLAQRQVRSPVDGVVIEQAMNPGDLTEVGDSRSSGMKIARINPLRVKAILPMSAYSRMKVGLKADVTPEKPLPGRYTTSVTVIDKVIDAASGTFQVRMELANPTGALPGGVKCKVAFSGL